MPITVASVVTRVKRRFNDFTDAVILEYMQEVNDDLHTVLNVFEGTEDLSALVVGTHEYALDEDIRKALNADLHKSATDIRPLKAIDKRQLKGAWRSQPNGDPNRFYVAGGSAGRFVGLVPAPGTATSGGYPFVRLYVTRKVTLTSGGNLPNGIASPDLYVFGVNSRICMDTKNEDRDFWEQKYQDQLKKEIALFWGQVPDSPPSILPFPMGGWGPV